jgi:hypothetical protein
MEWALWSLSETSGYDADTYHPQLVERHGRLLLIPSEPDAGGTQHSAVLAEAAANREYHHATRQAQGAAILGAASYSLAVVLIGYLITSQSLRVWQEAQMTELLRRLFAQ